MQLLFEEIFKKIFDVVDNIQTISIRLITKIVFSLLLVAGVSFIIIFSIIRETYVLFGVIFGLLILAEIAHFIRKSREKQLAEIATKKNMAEKNKKNKSERNKSHEISKNEYLLKNNKPKNEKLLLKKKK